MKRTVFLLIIMASIAVGVSAQDAQSIIRAARDLNKAETVQSRSRMVITARNGGTTERVIDQYSKDDANGLSRTVIVFQQPASVAGTRFLTIETTGASNDQWIFLPSLGRVRRIAASEGSGSFMGTDFSYDDISSLSRDANLDTHTILREETLNGRVCYVIESRPKDSSYVYSRMISWIDKANSRNYKIELYDRRNTLVKEVEFQDYQEIQSKPTPMRTTMKTLSAGTSTTIHTEIMRYDAVIPESVFTQRYLETGRP